MQPETLPLLPSTFEKMMATAAGRGKTEPQSLGAPAVSSSITERTSPVVVINTDDFARSASASNGMLRSRTDQAVDFSGLAASMKPTFFASCALAFLAGAGLPSWAAAPRAEFAIRWNAADGGPQTAAEVLAVLGASYDEEDSFKIQYFTVGATGGLPSGFSAIGRSRQKGKKLELTIKLRGPIPAEPLPELVSWDCGLGNADKKDEVDVSLLGGDVVKRIFSRSCSVESKDSITFPPSLGIQAKGCVNTMTRLKAGGIKVEEWLLMPSGTKLLEVSRNGADTNGDLTVFRSEIAFPLLAKGIKPLDRSKSEAGSDCS